MCTMYSFLAVVIKLWQKTQHFRLNNQPACAFHIVIGSYLVNVRADHVMSDGIKSMVLNVILMKDVVSNEETWPF